MTGLDFSTAAIEAARGLAVRAGLADRASFVCASLDDAARVLAPKTFDVVYVSFGALCWLPSVGIWADQVTALARPGSRVYLHDGHPVAWSLADDSLAIEHTYFEEPEPFTGDSEKTYTDAEAPLTNTRTYEWNHGIGEVVMALIDRGWRIDQLDGARLDRPPALSLVGGHLTPPLERAGRSAPGPTLLHGGGHSMTPLDPSMPEGYGQVKGLRGCGWSIRLRTPCGARRTGTPRDRRREAARWLPSGTARAFPRERWSA